MISPKGEKILELLSEASGGCLTIDELIIQAGAGASKQAMQGTVRGLEKRNLVTRRYELREGRVRLVVEATSGGLLRGSGVTP
jgi:hypothetical protein